MSGWKTCSSVVAYIWQSTGWGLDCSETTNLAEWNVPSTQQFDSFTSTMSRWTVLLNFNNSLQTRLASMASRWCHLANIEWVLSSSSSSAPSIDHSRLHELPPLWVIGMRTHPCCVETKDMGLDRRQSAGGRSMAARRIREWSCDGSVQAANRNPAPGRGVTVDPK